MNKTYKELGKIIRQHRKLKNISSIELSKKLNISTGTINNIENGRSDIFRLELLHGFITELSIPIDQLFTNIPPNLKISLLSDTNIFIPQKDTDLELIKHNLEIISKTFIDTASAYNCNEQAIGNITKTVVIQLETMKT